MDRKGVGGEAVMFGPFFVLLVVLFTGIYFGVNAYFSHSYDSRPIESQVLAERISDCFSRYDFFDARFNLSLCGLNEDVLSKNHLISVKDGTGHAFSLGVVDYATQCFLKGAEINPDYPKCFAIDLKKNGKTYSLLVGSNQLSIRGAS